MRTIILVICFVCELPAAVVDDFSTNHWKKVAGNPGASFGVTGNALSITVPFSDTVRDGMVIRRTNVTWPLQLWNAVVVRATIPLQTFLTIEVDCGGKVSRILEYREGKGTEETIAIPCNGNIPTGLINLSLGEPANRLATGNGPRTVLIHSITVENTGGGK